MVIVVITANAKKYFASIEENILIFGIVENDAFISLIL